jgi:hypothetical protein
MADSSKLIMIVGGAAVAYYAYTQGWLSSLGLGMPSDAAYAGQGTAVTAAQGSGCPNTYAYYSPSTKKYYCSATAPTATQTAAGSAAATAAATTAPVTPTPNAITGGNTLAGIYARMVAAAPSGSHAVDDWNTYLATAGNLTPPDPMPLFQAAVPGFDRSQLLTAAQYWGVMAPALTAQQGLTGMGRVFAGLGAIRATMRRG